MNVLKPRPGAEQMPPEAEQMPAEEAEFDESSPEYQDALQMAMDKLYKEGLIKQIVQAVGKAPSPVEGLADQSRMLLQVVDEATGGSVPDEAVMMLGITLMGEVAESLEAAGAKMTNRDLAAAMRMFIAGALEDMGADLDEVKQAMGQLDPEMAAQVMEG